MTGTSGTTRVGILLAAAMFALPGPSVAQSFSGNGPAATSPFVLLSGERAVTVSAAAPESFEAYLLSQNGAVVATLSGAERQEIRVPTDGRYVIDVRASDSWSIRIQEPDAMQLERARGRIEGNEAAIAQSSAAWLGKGLVGGLLLGPIGTAIAVNRAGRGEPELSSSIEERLSTASPEYRAAFREAYADRARGSQRASALIGGVTGTAILTFAILQFTVWGEQEQAEGELPGTGTPAARVPILRFDLPR